MTRYDVRIVDIDSEKPPEAKRCFLLSDVHGRADDIDTKYFNYDFDFLFFAGDMSNKSKYHEIKSFKKWINKMKAKYKIVVAGNHDLVFDREEFNDIIIGNHTAQEIRDLILKDKNIIYLEHEEITIEGIKIFGTPLSNIRIHQAFKEPYEDENDPHEEYLFFSIPDSTNIVLSHGVMKGYLDKEPNSRCKGSYGLRHAIDRVKPDLLICGHMHGCQGHTTHNNTTVILPSFCKRDKFGEETNNPYIIDIIPKLSLRMSIWKKSEKIPKMLKMNFPNVFFYLIFLILKKIWREELFVFEFYHDGFKVY